MKKKNYFAKRLHIPKICCTFAVEFEMGSPQNANAEIFCERKTLLLYEANNGISVFYHRPYDR